MSESSTINLATVGTAELEAMSVPVFASCLESMSNEAIVRFKRMRKLSASHRSALEKYLVEHPENRPGGEDDLPPPKVAPAGAKGKKAKKTGATSAKGKKTGATSPKSEKPAGVDRRGSFPDFKKRLRAWWVGVEVKDLDTLDKQRGKAASPAKAKKTNAQPKPKSPPPQPAPSAPSMSKAEVLQMLWGAGYMLPGGDDFALKLVKGLTFHNSLPYLDISAGLGGGTSAVAQHHKVTVEGVEVDPGLAEAALGLLTARGIADASPIRCADPLSENLGEGKYAAIFARETLFTIPDRKTLLRNMATSLSPSGSIVLTDFMLVDRTTSSNPELEAWQQAEPARALPFTLEEYSELLDQAQFAIRTSKDLSTDYIGFIQAGWRKLHTYLQTAKLSPETANMLMAEGNIWLARCKALESGDLRLISVQGTLKPTNLMTDPETNPD